MLNLKSKKKYTNEQLTDEKGREVKRENNKILLDKILKLYKSI